LFKADVPDYCSLAAAFAGCEGVFHPGCPTATESMWILRFDDHGCIMCRSLRLLVAKCKHRILHLNYREFFFLHRKRETVAPIVKGTKNVLEACSATSVQKLVVVSTVAGLSV
jgi:hypothetical protein